MSNFKIGDKVKINTEILRPGDLTVYKVWLDKIGIVTKITASLHVEFNIINDYMHRSYSVSSPKNFIKVITQIFPDE